MPRSSPRSAVRFPLDLILGAPSHVRILRELSLHGGQLPSSDLARRTRLTAAAVRTALAQMESIGIVERHGTLRTNLYKISKSNPLAGAITKVYGAEAKRYADFLEQVAQVGASYPKRVLAIWLYGSVARGEDRVDSDLDILVVANIRQPDLEGEIEYRERIVSIAKKFAINASVVVIDPLDLKRMDDEDSPWLRRLLEDARKIYGAEPDDMLKRLTHRPKVGKAL